MSRRAVPTFKDLRNMTDLEVVKAIMPQMGCYKCGRNSGLHPTEVCELGANGGEGLRKLGVVIHCPSCGLLDRKVEVFVPTTAEAYIKIFALGQAGDYASRKFSAGRSSAKPGKSKLRTGRHILKRFGLERFVDGKGN